MTHGPFHDYYPCPLADGGLAFISTRCRARFLCWRPQAFVLFRMDADGENIRPLSFANLSEWSPAMMRDGRILWTRSEYLDKGANFGHTLWAIHPDGTHPELIFGNNTINCYMNGREVPGSREICCTIFSHGGDHNGPLGLIDLAKGPFDSAALTNITPDIDPRYDMSWPAQECFRDPTPDLARLFPRQPRPGRPLGPVRGRSLRQSRDALPGPGDRQHVRHAAAAGAPAAGAEPSGSARRSRQGDWGSSPWPTCTRDWSRAVPRGKVKYLRVCQEVRRRWSNCPTASSARTTGRCSRISMPRPCTW